MVALYAAELLKLPQAYWAAISAFVVMGANVRATVQASSGRLMGTAIGAVAGAVFVVLWGSHLWSFGLAATLTALVCAVLRLDQSYRLACVTVAIVMLIHSARIPLESRAPSFPGSRAGDHGRAADFSVAAQSGSAGKVDLGSRCRRVLRPPRQHSTDRASQDFGVIIPSPRRPARHPSSRGGLNSSGSWHPLVCVPIMRAAKLRIRTAACCGFTPRE